MKHSQQNTMNTQEENPKVLFTLDYVNEESKLSRKICLVFLKNLD